MRYFYDTEFIDDGSTIDLISIGIVAEDGTEYYAVSSDFNIRKALAHPWLPDNVLAYLPMTDGGKLDFTHPSVKPRSYICKEVSEFLHSTGTELWAYYSAYDHVALAQLFGSMVNLPKHIPMRTKDLADLIDAHDAWGFLPSYGGTRHHALDDAREVKMRYDFLMNRSK